MLMGESLSVLTKNDDMIANNFALYAVMAYIIIWSDLVIKRSCLLRVKLKIISPVELYFYHPRELALRYFQITFFTFGQSAVRAIYISTCRFAFSQYLNDNTFIKFIIYIIDHGIRVMCSHKWYHEQLNRTEKNHYTLILSKTACSLFRTL